MKFKVKRTSIMPGDEKPCEEAFEIKKCCDRASTQWFVNIRNLKEFVAFCDKYGQVVLDGRTIEIYDYYRE